MNITLLIFFVLPLAVIIISIALQRLLSCPILVSAIIFVIFLIVAVLLNNLNVLILAIVYAIIAYIAAIVSCIICKILRRFPDLLSCTNCCRGSSDEENNSSNSIATLNAAVSIDNIDTSNTVELLSDSIISNNSSDSTNTCGCSRNISSCDCNDSNSNSNSYVAQARIVPSANTNGRSGSFRGCYRRR